MVIVTTQNIDNREQHTLGLVTIVQPITENPGVDAQLALQKLMEQTTLAGGNAIVALKTCNMGSRSMLFLGTAVRVK